MRIIGEHIAFKGEDEVDGGTAMMVEITEVGSDVIELAFDFNKVRHYIRVNPMDLFKVVHEYRRGN